MSSCRDICVDATRMHRGNPYSWGEASILKSETWNMYMCSMGQKEVQSTLSQSLRSRTGLQHECDGIDAICAACLQKPIKCICSLSTVQGVFSHMACVCCAQAAIGISRHRHALAPYVHDAEHGPCSFCISSHGQPVACRCICITNCLQAVSLIKSQITKLQICC